MSFCGSTSSVTLRAMCVCLPRSTRLSISPLPQSRPPSTFPYLTLPYLTVPPSHRRTGTPDKYTERMCRSLYLVSLRICHLHWRRYLVQYSRYEQPSALRPQWLCFCFCFCFWLWLWLLPCGPNQRGFAEGPCCKKSRNKHRLPVAWWKNRVTVSYWDHR